MTQTARTSSQPGSAVPPDDTSRSLAVADPEARNTRRVAVAGDTYTILLTGEQTGGRYCLIDMHVPPGGGPPPHRHDFEEMFTVLEGEIEVRFRGKARMVGAGSTLNIPANAPHAFKNTSRMPARLLCMGSPPGQEEFFMAVGDPVQSRRAPPPDLSRQEQDQRRKRAETLVAQYRTEVLAP